MYSLVLVRANDESLRSIHQLSLIGLGGTSLLNAGVFMRPCEDVLRSKEWPSEIRISGSLNECERTLTLARNDKADCERLQAG